ncbi:uncharacterized protein LOC132903004 [Amyelois transitella]|uniref:uncharacterized protein LOC132903004 n=1 Tax=Amyelois transitella TaxID=680683 RepID=UPI00298FFC16|nr:uncharacterized protein LOC132903004 [Amyelois transitella]
MLMYMNIFIGMMLLNIPLLLCSETTTITSEEVKRIKRTKRYCHLLKICSHFKGPICGRDRYARFFKTFDNICKMYEENCFKGTRYYKIDFGRCQAKEDFMKVHGNSSSDWQASTDFDIPLLTSITDKPKNKQYTSIFERPTEKLDSEEEFYKKIPGLGDMLRSSNSTEKISSVG